MRFKALPDKGFIHTQVWRALFMSTAAYTPKRAKKLGLLYYGKNDNSQLFPWNY